MCRDEGKRGVRRLIREEVMRKGEVEGEGNINRGKDMMGGVSSG